MTCEKFQDQFVEYFLGELSASEELAVRQHLSSGCADCVAEFQAIGDATELLFAAAPRTTLSSDRCQEIQAQALQATHAANTGKTNHERQLNVAARTPPGSHRSSGWYGLLAVVAGFSLVLLYPRTQLDEAPQVAQGSSMQGSLPVPTATPKFVSFEDASQVKQLVGHEVAGFLLVDARAGEVHLLGKSVVPAFPLAPLELHILTASGSVHYPLNFSQSGVCKTIVPLPPEPILKIEIVGAAQTETQALRRTGSGQVR